MNYFHSGWRDELTAVHSARPPARGSQMSLEVLELLRKGTEKKTENILIKLMCSSLNTASSSGDPVSKTFQKN